MNTANNQELSDYIAKHYPNNVFPKKTDSEEGSQYCLNLEFYRHELSEKETNKQALYEQNGETTGANQGNWTVENQSSDPIIKNASQLDILDDLTEDDIRLLMMVEDEVSQGKGSVN